MRARKGGLARSGQFAVRNGQRCGQYSCLPVDLTKLRAHSADSGPLSTAEALTSFNISSTDFHRVVSALQRTIPFSASTALGNGWSRSPVNWYDWALAQATDGARVPVAPFTARRRCRLRKTLAWVLRVYSQCVGLRWAVEPARMPYRSTRPS